MKEGAFECPYKECDSYMETCVHRQNYLDGYQDGLKDAIEVVSMFHNKFNRTRTKEV